MRPHGRGPCRLRAGAGRGAEAGPGCGQCVMEVTGPGVERCWGNDREGCQAGPSRKQHAPHPPLLMAASRGHTGHTPQPVAAWSRLHAQQSPRTQRHYTPMALPHHLHIISPRPMHRERHKVNCSGSHSPYSPPHSLAMPWPMRAEPAPDMMARTSAKSTLISPGTCRQAGGRGGGGIVGRGTVAGQRVLASGRSARSLM